MATLTSTDVESTMKRLDYAPGIVSDDMTLLFDVSWFAWAPASSMRSNPVRDAFSA